MAEPNKNKTSKKQKGLVDKIKAQYSNDPFFVKKRALSLLLIQKAGLPESFIRR